MAEDERLTADRDLFWKAHRLSEAGAYDEALPLWDELAHFDDPEVVRTGRIRKGQTLLELGRYREAHRIYAVLAAEKVSRRCSRSMLAWFGVFFWIVSGKLHLRAPLLWLRRKYGPPGE